MNEKLVSILMPVYNAEKYLIEAIDSVLNQTYYNIELVIINDGSSDNSENIINKYSDKRIRYYKNEVNLGLIKSLNKGIQLCKGLYIARMDSDDICHPDRILKQVEFLSNNHQYVLCGTRCEFIHSGKKRLFNITSPGDDLGIRSFFLVNSPLIHPSVMFKKSVIEDNNLLYDSSYKDAEDYKFWIDISKYGKLIILEEILLYYRLSTTQISQSNNSIQLSNAEKIRNDYFYDIVNAKNTNLLENMSYSNIKSLVKDRCREYPDISYFLIRKKNVAINVKIFLIFNIVKQKRLWQLLPSIKRLFFK